MQMALLQLIEKKCKVQAVFNVQFSEYCTEVGLDRAFRDIECACDRFVVATAMNHLRYLNFPWRQMLDRAVAGKTAVICSCMGISRNFTDQFGDQGPWYPDITISV